jgi:hypothetical protein
MSAEKLAKGAMAVTGRMKIKLIRRRKIIAQVAGFALFPVLIFTSLLLKKTVWGNSAGQ